MNSVVYEVSVYIVEALISGIFFVNVLQSKYNKVLQLAIWCEVVIIAMLFTPAFSLTRIGLIAILELLFIWFFYKDQVKKKISAYLFKQSLVIMSAALAYSFYSLFIEQHESFFASCKSDNCTYCLLYLILFSVLTSIVCQFSKPKRGVEVPWVVGTIAIAGCGEVTSVLSVADSLSGVINTKESWFVVIAMVCFVTANISVGMLAPFLLRQVSQSNNMDYGQEISNMEYKYYEMSVENEKKIHAMKHDISNHIQTIYSLFSNGEEQKGFEFIAELKEHYSGIDRIVYCNNPVINIILANKKSDAEKKNIDVQINVKENIESLYITDFDLSTVICNLLDNAIRGCVCSDQSHPRMIVEILKKNQYLVIRVLNSCKIGMNIENTDRIETTKSNSQTHGFGMPIIAGIAKKYRGDFIVSAQNGIFTATVVMSLKNNN